MLKNLKLLKGITVFLALCLLVGGGFLIKNQVDAASKTVVYYVSEDGDNTTGEDAATAFNSIETAIKNANSLALPAGTDVKIIVVGRVNVTSEKIDGALVTNEKGERVRVTITSEQNSTDRDDFSEIYLTYIGYTDGYPSSTQRAIVNGDVTFKNIRIRSKVFPGEKVDGTGTDYYTKNLNLNGNVIMDNVDLTNDYLMEGNTSLKWTIYCDHQTNIGLNYTPYFKKNIEFIDCDFVNTVGFIYVNQRNAPGYDMTVDFSGKTTTNYVYAVTNNCRKMTVNFNDGCYIDDFYLGKGSGKYTIPEGVTINYNEGSTVGALWGSDGDKGAWTTNFTQNVRGNIGQVISGRTTYDVQFGPKAQIKGDFTTNFYETCNVDAKFTRSKSIFLMGTFYGADGVVTTNIYGGTFRFANFYFGPANSATGATMAHPVQAKDGDGNPMVDENGDPVWEMIPETDANGEPVLDENGDPVMIVKTTNRYTYREENTQEKYSLKEHPPIKQMVTTIHGGSFSGDNVIVASRHDPVGSAIIDIKGGTFTCATTLGNYFGPVLGDVKVTVSGGSYANTLYTFGRGGDIGGDAIAEITGGSFSAPIYGTYGTAFNSSYPAYYKGEFLAAGYVKKATVHQDVYFKITNMDSWGTKTTMRFLRSVEAVKGDLDFILDASGDPSHKIGVTGDGFNVTFGCRVDGETRTYVDGGEHKGITLTGFSGAASSVRTINTVKNCKIEGSYYGFRDTGVDTCDVFNTLEEVEITENFYGGISNTSASLEGACRDITNTLTDCSWQKYFGATNGNKSTSSCRNITNVLTDCVSTGNTYLGGSDKGGADVLGTVKNFLTNVDMTGVNYVANTGTIHGDIYTVIDGGKCTNTFYAGCANGTVKGSIYNQFTNFNLVKGCYAGGRDGRVEGNVTTVLGVGNTVDGDFIGSPAEAVEFGGVATLTINDGTFAGTVYGAKICPVGDLVPKGVNLIINGGTFNSATDYGCFQAAFATASNTTKIDGDVVLTVTNIGEVKKFVRGVQNVDEITGDFIANFDTTGDAANSIKLPVEVQLGTGVGAVNGTIKLNVDGGPDKKVDVSWFIGCGVPGANMIHTVKNAKVAGFAGVRDTGAANIVNNFENVNITNFYGANSNKNLGCHVTGTITNNLKNVTISSGFTGGSNGKGTAIETPISVGDIVNNLTDCSMKTYIGGNGVGAYVADTTARYSYAGDIHNTLNNVNVTTSYQGGSSASTEVEVENITNIVKLGDQAMTGTFLGAMNRGIVNDVSTTILDGTFTGTVYAVGSSSALTQNGSSYFRIDDGSYKGLYVSSGVVRPGLDAQGNYPAKKQNLTLIINGGTFSSPLNGYEGGIVNGDFVFTMTGGTFATGTNLRPLNKITAPINGDFTVTLDTTESTAKNIVIAGFDVSTSSTTYALGTSTLYINGGMNSAIVVDSLTSFPSAEEMNVTIKNATIKKFGAIRGCSAVVVPKITSLYENVVFGESGNVSAAGAIMTGLSTYFTEAETTVKDCTFASAFYGGTYAAAGSYAKKITNTIINSTFEGSFYGSDAKKTSESVKTTIRGGTFLGNVYGAGSASSAVDIELIFNPTAGPISFAKTPVVQSSTIKKLELLGAGHPILLNHDSKLTFTDYDGAAQTFAQTENWVKDQVYVTFPEGTQMDKISAKNYSESVTGIGETEGITIKGSDGTVTVVPAAPVEKVSFQIGDLLDIRFWASKDKVKAYIDEYGAWSYQVMVGSEEVASKTFTSMDQFAADDIRTDDDGEFVSFAAGLNLNSSEYDKSFSVKISGVDAPTVMTAFELLEYGIYSIDEIQEPELVNLLCAMYNYGAEAKNKFAGGNMDVKFKNDVVEPQKYTGTVTATGSEGYGFLATSISMDKMVALNYYFYAPGKTPADLTFAVADSQGVLLDGAQIKVKEVVGQKYYNMIVTVSFKVSQMAETYTLKVSDATGEVATCTNSIPIACMTYINDPSSAYADVSKALLSYVEASQAYLATLAK